MTMHVRTQTMYQWRNGSAKRQVQGGKYPWVLSDCLVEYQEEKREWRDVTVFVFLCYDRGRGGCAFVHTKSQNTCLSRCDRIVLSVYS